MDKNNICNDEKIERFKYIEQIVKEILKNKKVKTLEDFESEINKYDIEIKYKNTKGKFYKNITYKEKQWERGFRGKFDISLENIISRINNIEHEECLTPYKRWCYKTHKNSYAKFIKESIDIAVMESMSINDLVENLKNKYGIKMEYLSKSDKPLRRVKFFILNSNQKNKIGSASLDEENREEYEYSGLKNRCEQRQEVKVNGDLLNNLKNIQKYLISNNQKDRWRIDEGIEIVVRRNLRSQYDINNQIKILEKKSEFNNSRIKLINKDIEEIESLYSQIYYLTQKYNEMNEELKKMNGFKALINKKNLENKIQDYNNEINNLKESRYYSKELKYSERIHALTDEKYELIEENRCNDTEIEILDQVKYIDKNKENIINYKQEENEIDDSLRNENRDI